MAIFTAEFGQKMALFWLWYCSSTRVDKMADSHDRRSSSRESAPKFPKCSPFRKKRDNPEHCQQCRFNDGDHECSRQTPCVVSESWLTENWDAHKKAKSQKLKRKVAAASKKLQEAMDNSVEIHTPEETLGPQEKKSKKSDRSSHHKLKSKSDKPATESCSGGVQLQVVCPSRSDGMSRTETGTDRHHWRSRNEDRRKDRYSSDHGSSRHLSEWRRSPHHHSSELRRPSSSSGQEKNSTSRAATPTDSRRHNSMGQQGSSRQSRAEGRDSGSTAQPAASNLSRRETTSGADLSGHPGSSQQASE